MSYGGHALDMIKRLKEGREPLKRRREQAKQNRKAYRGRLNLPSNLTAEKVEEVNRMLREYEEKKQRDLFRMTLFAVCAIAIVVIIVFVMIRLHLFV